jgi:hypothetical protein
MNCFPWSKILEGKSQPGQLDPILKLLTTPCASQGGGGGGGELEFLGNASGYSEGQSLGELDSQSTLLPKQMTFT